MHQIVLVKQVPDVSKIPEDAWDREKGTLRRGVLDNVLNPLDLHAVTFACNLREAFPGEPSRVICLTMGPPQSRDMLVECIARGADEAVLMTDRAFSGADTWATAYSLGQGIRKIAREILKTDRYVLVTGMQSVDGDTAQVPAQVAEELGIEHIAYAQSFQLEGGLSIKRIGPTGMEVVQPLAYPFLVTLTAATQPRYRSFHRTRAARQQKITEWAAKDVEADPKRIGIPGSRTTVSRIYSPSEDKHKECAYFTEAEPLVEALVARYRQGPPKAAESAGAVYQLDGKEPSYKGEVWVYAEQEGGVLKSVSLELIAEARKLAAGLREKVVAVVLGHRIDQLPAELIARGADKVHVVDHPLLEHFLPVAYKKAVGELVVKFRPQIMLFGASPLGRELAPRVAYSSDAGLTADCTRLEIADVQRGSTSLVAVLKQTRPALGGNIMATILTKDSKTQMATVRPGVFKANPPDPGRKGEVVRHAPALSEADVKVKIVSMEPLPPRSSVADADIVVSGGRGLGTKAKYDRFIRELARSMAGVLEGGIEVGASRMAVEDGFIGHDHQVGQTGQTVQPRLYVAAGISGAVQHISGMQNAEIVVVVNKDARARIFNYADFGMVGDLETLLPQLAQAFERRKKS